MLLIDLLEVESMMTSKMSKISCKYLFSREEKEDSKYQFVYIIYFMDHAQHQVKKKIFFSFLLRKKMYF